MRAYLLAFASLPFFAFACFDRLGADPQFDAGVFHFDGGTFDGTIPDGAALPDAMPTSDGPPVEAGPLPVKIVVLKGGLPEPGVNVIFQDATGAVVEAKTTAIDGTASRVVDPGTMVTALLGTTVARKAVTVVGVQPGDVLTALDDPDEPLVFDPVSVDVAANAPTAASTFQAHSGACTSPASQIGPLAYNVSPPDCEHRGKFPVLVVANDANALPVGFSFEKGNVVDVDAGTTSVTSPSAWATPSSVAITATGAPATGSVYLAYSEIADGIPFSSGAQGLAVAGAFAHTFTTYPGYADSVQLEVGTSGVVSNSYSTTTANASRVTPPAAPTSLDFTQLLPAFTTVVEDQSDPTRPGVALTTAAAPTGADGLVVQMSWSTMDPDAGVVAGQWIIVAPATTTTTTVKAPALPPALASWAPAAGATFDLSSAVIVDSDQLPGYAQLRSLFATFPSPGQFGQSGVLPPLPSNGKLRVSSISPAPM